MRNEAEKQMWRMKETHEERVKRYEASRQETLKQMAAEKMAAEKKN
jgi:hypothetical protein